MPRTSGGGVRSGWVSVRFTDAGGNYISDVLSPGRLGPYLRGFLVIPTADPTVYTSHGSSVVSLRAIAEEHGLSLQSQGEEGGGAGTIRPSTNAVPFAGNSTGPRVSGNAVPNVTVRPPVPRVQPAAPVSGPVPVEGQRIRFRRAPINPTDVGVDPRLSAVEQRRQQRTFQRQASENRMAANQAAQDAILPEKGEEELAAVRVQGSVVEEMVSLLLARSSSINERLRAEVLSSSTVLANETSSLMTTLGQYHAGRFIVTEGQRLLSEINSEEKKAERAEKLKILSAAFGVTQEELERKFVAEATKVITSFTNGQNPSLRAVEEKVQRVVFLSGEIEAKKLLLETSGRERREKLAQEVGQHFETIKKLPFVKGVKLSGAVLIVETSDVVITWDKRKWNLGRYEMRINLKPGAGEVIPVSFKALDLRAGSGDEGPHIIANGHTICWGGVREGVTKLCAEWNWSMLVNVLWLFLHSYTHADCYRKLPDLFERAGRVAERI